MNLTMGPIVVCRQRQQPGYCKVLSIEPCNPLQSMIGFRIATFFFATCAAESYFVLVKLQLCSLSANVYGLLSCCGHSSICGR